MPCVAFDKHVSIWSGGIRCRYSIYSKEYVGKKKIRRVRYTRSLEKLKQVFNNYYDRTLRRGLRSKLKEKKNKKRGGKSLVFWAIERRSNNDFSTDLFYRRVSCFGFESDPRAKELEPSATYVSVYICIHKRLTDFFSVRSFQIVEDHRPLGKKKRGKIEERKEKETKKKKKKINKAA